jgi:hypothetical protein
MKNNRINNRAIDPENIINFDGHETKGELGLIKDEMKGAGTHLSFGGYNKTGLEVNFFPNVKLFPKEEENILMILGHGLFINTAKHISGNKYKACYALEKTYCYPDKFSTVSLTQQPQFLMYYELFMMREDQKELKLNCVTKLPTVVVDEIKHLYKDFIPDCYKKDIYNKSVSKSISKSIRKSPKKSIKQSKKFKKKTK